MTRDAEQAQIEQDRRAHQDTEAQSISTEMFSDELVKNALTDYAAEQFEIGAYTALIAAADELGETEVAQLCQQNLKEDKAMAAWLAKQLPVVVRETMARTAR